MLLLCLKYKRSKERHFVDHLSEFVKFDSIKEQIYRFTNLNKEHVYILKCSGFPVSQSHMEDRT